MPDNRIESLWEVVCGQTSTQLANVYFRWRGDSRAKISGYVEGPFCTYGETLPARTTLTDLGPGDGQLFQAAVVDPVFWTPLHPTQYRLELELTEPGREPLRVSREFGIRFFGTRGRDFVLEAKRWVFRGMTLNKADDEQLQECRELMSGVVLSGAADNAETLEAATKFGVPLMVDLCGLKDEELERTLRRLCWHPAVLVVALDGAAALPPETRQAAANLCLAERLHALTDVPSDWANAVRLDWEMTDGELTTDSGGPAPSKTTAFDRQLPVLVHRPATGSLAKRRAACDELQRDMVRHGDFAAYLV